MLIDVALMNDLWKEAEGVEPPSVLWHYTSIPAAISILQSHSVRLGCHAFMNDPSEGTAAGLLVAKCWHEAVDQAASHPRLDLAYIRDTTSALSYFDFSRPELPPTFLFSLTELRDSLSQWSRYGDNGAGIALGFAVRSDDLPQESHKPWRTRVQALRVIYDGDEPHESSLRRLVAKLLAEYLPKFGSPTQIENTLISLIHGISPIVKLAPYSEEREWRMATRTTVDSVEVYEIGHNKFGISPYVSLPFGKGIEVVEVMLGPKLSPENAWSATWLCRKVNAAATVSRSALAYR